MLFETLITTIRLKVHNQLLIISLSLSLSLALSLYKSVKCLAHLSTWFCFMSTLHGLRRGKGGVEKPMLVKARKYMVK